MASAKVTYDGEFYLYSSWQCWNVTVANGQPTGKYQFRDKPTTDEKTITFDLNLPSGAVPTSIQVYATITSPFTGYSILTANGNGFRQVRPESILDVFADQSVEGITNSIDITFQFKANGNLVDTNSHISSVMFSNIFLAVEYEGGAEEVAESSSETESEEPPIEFAVPPQSVCIYHQSTGKIYMFDGVTKIQHVFAVKLEENAKADTKDKDKVVNNATNEPDKLTLDVVMSDVYTDNNNMTIANGWDADQQSTSYSKTKDSVISDFTRSGNAAYVLRRLKEERSKLSVITPQYVHVDMILSNVTITQDDECPFGWVGQIEFQHAYKPKPVEQDWKSPTDTSTPTNSNASELLVSDDDAKGTTPTQTPTQDQTPTKNNQAAISATTKAKLKFITTKFVTKAVD